MAIMKRYGDQGQPCLTPFSNYIFSDKYLLFITLQLVLLFIILTQFIRFPKIKKIKGSYK